MQVIRTIIHQAPVKKLLFLLIVIFISYFTFVAFSRHDNFHSRRLDLGNMEQTVWNVAHGNGFTLTDPMGTKQISRIAVHADFLLILMTPFYLLWSSPKMLILVQTIIIALGALPVYWIANDTLKNKYLAFLFAFVYLLYPPLERMALHDFHAVALSMTFLLFAYWYMAKEKYVPFVIFSVLAGLGKEHVWIAIGLMGLYIAIRNHKARFGVLVSIISFAIFYYLFWVAIPAVAPNGQHFALAYLSEFGGSQNGVMLGLLKHPFTVIATLVKPDRLEYYYQLLFPVGFLPLFSPFALIFGAHNILINALSNNGLMRQIDYQYTSGITPFLFVAAIEGYGKVLQFITKYTHGRNRKRMPEVVALVFMSIVFIGSYLWGELPLTRQDRFFYFIWALPEKEMMHQVEQSVGSRYTVSVTNNIGSHFANREKLYNFPVNALSSDYSIARLGDQYAWPSGDEQEKTVELLLQSPEYVLMARQGDFYAFKRK